MRAMYLLLFFTLPVQAQTALPPPTSPPTIDDAAAAGNLAAAQGIAAKVAVANLIDGVGPLLTAMHELEDRALVCRLATGASPNGLAMTTAWLAVLNDKSRAVGDIGVADGEMGEGTSAALAGDAVTAVIDYSLASSLYGFAFLECTAGQADLATFAAELLAFDAALRARGY